MKTPLTIVTGASSNHFMCLQNLLWTISRFEPTARVIAYDLGLTQAEHESLRDVPPFYLKNWEFRTFDFSRYPAYFEMNEQAGYMGFRPVTVASAAREFGGLVFWLDAGCQLLEPLDGLRALVQKNGVYCPCAPGLIRLTLYPTARAPLGVTDELLEQPVRDAGVCGFDTTRPDVMELIERWEAVTLVKEMTAPDGSKRRTNCPDAVFAVLLNQAAARHGWTLEGRRHRGMAIKQDRVTLAETKFRTGIR